MTESPAVRLKGAGKVYGQRALHPTDFDLASGSCTAVIGPSGCGKSTLLRLVAGLEEPSEGSVEVLGTPMTPVNSLALRRQMGYVIQEGGLFPHLTARGNVELMARHLRVPPKTEELARLVRLDPAMLDRTPDRLSGGQRQRVGIMRALMLSPKLLLLDEPMGALDPLVRRDLQEDLKEIIRETGTSVLLVTHDLPEAAFLADRILVMNEGRVVQDGSYGDLVARPADAFVSKFVNAQRLPAVGSA